MLQQKIYFKSLDTLRFFAFFMVFCQHAFRSEILFTEGSFLSKIPTLLCNGPLGVSFFFVLSGYLITHLILREINQTGSLNIISFYIRRALRIWPLYYSLLIFTLILYPLIKDILGYEPFNYGYTKWMHFLFLSNFDVIRAIHLFPGHNAVMISITWSVAIEEQFYLVWPLLFGFIPKKYYRYIFPFIILISLLFRMLQQDDITVLYFHTLSVMNDLAIGGYAAYLTLNNRWFLKFFTTLKKASIILVYITGFFLLLFHGDLIRIAHLGIFIRIFDSLFFVFIIMEQNFSPHSFKKFGDWNILSDLGKITYGLYLLHPVCIQFIELTWNYFFPHADPFYSLLIKGCLSFGCSVLICTLSYRYFESYFLKIKERF